MKLHNLNLHVENATVSFFFLTMLCYRVKHTKELELTFQEDFFHPMFKICFLMSIFISPITTESTHYSTFFFREHLSNPEMILQKPFKVMFVFAVLFSYFLDVRDVLFCPTGLFMSNILGSFIFVILIFSPRE